MIQKITPFLWFEQNAEEAINYYVSVFNTAPGKKTDSKILSIQRYPKEAMMKEWEGMAGKIITAVFELEGQRFMALDGGPVFKPSGAISFLVECENQEQVDHYWNKLSDDGAPEAQQCGWLQDKFGFMWQINPTILGKLLSDPDKAKADRAMKAMLQMKKLDIAALLAAAGE
jgi:predicted 3-demethylubiquinone-9 3-methyltransferase (glyoxalase superfamily)